MNQSLRNILFLFFLSQVLLCRGLNADSQLEDSVLIVSASERALFSGTRKIADLDGPIRSADFQNNVLAFQTRHGALQIYDFKTKNLEVTGAAMKRLVNFEDSSREITGLDIKCPVLSHKHNLVFFQDHENPYELKHDISGSRLLTSVHCNGNDLYAGTGVNGLYYAAGGLKQAKEKKSIRFVRINAGLAYVAHSKNAFMYEEIRAIQTGSKGTIFVATGIEGGVFYKTKDSRSFQRIEWNGPKYADIYRISVSADESRLWVSSTAGLTLYSRIKGAYKGTFRPWKEILAKYGAKNRFLLFASNTDPNLTAVYLERDFYLDSAKEKRMKDASGKRLFYTSAYKLSGKKTKIKELLQGGNYNGVVLDVKDDFGYIRYKSETAFAKKIGAVRDAIDLKKFIKEVHDQKKYIVVRIVVFKDPVLFKQKGFAILDEKTKKPWIGLEGERWVDPYNEDIAKLYYVPLVQELEKWGVDEIQLDYIRFPSDGGVQRCFFSHQKPGQYYSEAMENFLHAIRQAINIPLGVDIYGYNGLYRSPGIIGQDIEAYGRHADVVSPMLYSSHFGDLYMTNLPMKNRTYALIKRSVSRGVFLANGNFLLRPYLQAFPMKTKIWGYGKTYFFDQVKATFDSGVEGFSFWGSMEHMAAAEPAIADYFKK